VFAGGGRRSEPARLSGGYGNDQAGPVQAASSFESPAFGSIAFGAEPEHDHLADGAVARLGRVGWRSQSAVEPTSTSPR
jgi:hypothetical protein